MTNRHGDFIWYELLTTDASAAADFYAAVLGWTYRTMETPNGPYLIASSAAGDIAGLMTLPQDAQDGGARPFWVGYLAVEDVDASVAAITEAGGSVHMPAMDMPGVGRFAMVGDPQGAVFYVMRGESDEASNAFGAAPGQWNWNELTTSDQHAALDFYCARFGWAKGDAMPMGEQGEYRFIHQSEPMIGAIMNGAPDGPPPHWMFYYGVPDIDAAAEALGANGGEIRHGPAEVPGGSYIVVGADPQGASIGMVGPRVT